VFSFLLRSFWSRIRVKKPFLSRRGKAVLRDYPDYLEISLLSIRKEAINKIKSI
jgi:hypothetical protein